MADVITNMKVRFGADTKNFKKGLDEGKQSSKQFSKDAGSAFDSFAAAFGVNMSKVREGLNSVKASLTGTTAGFKAASAGSTGFSRALGILKTALISTGIGALVVALGSLITYFTKTQRGADFVSKVMKGLGATFDVLRDRVSALGEIIFKAFSDPKQAISDLWEAIKTNIVNRFEGLIDLFRAVGGGLEALWKRDMEGLKQAATEAGTALVQMTTGLDENQQKRVADSIKGVVTEIKEESAAAAELETRRQKLRDREIELIEVQARRRKELEQARLLAEDETISAEKRREALQRALDLEKQTLQENQALQREKIAIMEAEIDLGESMASDYRTLAEEKARLQEIEGQSARLQRRVVTEMNSLTREIEAQTEAIKKQREEQTGMFVPMEGLSFAAPTLEMPKLETDKLLAGLKTDLAEAENIILDFSDVFNETFTDLAFSFGEQMGALIAGTGSFGDFGNIILGSLGDLAIKIGKMAISTGMAVAGIKKALQSMNPYVAIAAGVALVALGYAIKSSLANAANGSGGGDIGSNSFVFDSRGASGGFGGTQPNAQTQPQTVNVNITGEFRQRGTDMVATIKETNKRASYSR